MHIDTAAAFAESPRLEILRLAVDDRCRCVLVPLATVSIVRINTSALEWRESAAGQNSEIRRKRMGDQKPEVVQNSEKFSEFSHFHFV